MTLNVGQIEFGEVDAKNEVLEQEKFGSSIFKNGFRMPPGIDTDKLVTGAKCFIYGQKGCGKTALLLYIRSILNENNAQTKTVLFKSGITERERQKISGSGFTLVDQDYKISVEYDYKINWLWYIYRNLIRLINENQVIQNWDVALSLKRLLGVHGEVNTNLLSDLSAKKIKAFANAAIKVGPLTAEIGAEVESIAKNDENSDIEIIDIVEKYIHKIVLHPKHRSVLLFDELELFWNRDDQRERDLFLIRDLLYAVSRVNRTVGSHNASLGVIASVRSEVLNEVNRVGPEISRDVSDRGVRVHWNVRSDEPTQPILQIVEAKINASEIELDQIPTEDVWGEYFPKRVFGREIKQYLLDISMFKPRNLISLLSESKIIEPDALSITEDAIQQAQDQFSKRIWTEIEEGLLGEFEAGFVKATKSLLVGFKPRFSIQNLIERKTKLASADLRIRSAFPTDHTVVEAIEALYRLGAVGNNFNLDEKGAKRNRQHWMYRDNYEPLIDKPFVIHESLRKELQISFVG